MEDFRQAEEKCILNIDKKKAEMSIAQGEGKKEDPSLVVRLKIDEEVLQAIKLMTRMILLAADNTRKDPVNLPLMVYKHTS